MLRARSGYRPFSQAPPNTAATNSFLAMMLTDTNLAGAENGHSKFIILLYRLVLTLLA